MNGPLQLMTIMALLIIRKSRGNAYGRGILEQMRLARGRPCSPGHLHNTLRTLRRHRFIEYTGAQSDDWDRRGPKPLFIRITRAGEAELDRILRTMDILRGPLCLTESNVSKPPSKPASSCVSGSGNTSTKSIATPSASICSEPKRRSATSIGSRRWL